MKKIVTILLFVIMILGSTGCENHLNKTLETLSEKVYSYEGGYSNFAASYVDEKAKVVIVELINNSEEEQKWFRENILDSDYIKFIQGGPYSAWNYKKYEMISSLHSKKVDTTILVKFNGILYGKSNSIIDYATNSESVGIIDKLIPNPYVPKLNGETNSKKLLNAQVFNNTEKSVVLLYNNEYILFEKI